MGMFWILARQERIYDCWAEGRGRGREISEIARLLRDNASVWQSWAAVAWSTA
jgi:hypothetical protein